MFFIILFFLFPLHSFTYPTFYFHIPVLFALFYFFTNSFLSFLFFFYFFLVDILFFGQQYFLFIAVLIFIYLFWRFLVSLFLFFPSLFFAFLSLFPPHFVDLAQSLLIYCLPFFFFSSFPYIFLLLPRSPPSRHFFTLWCFCDEHLATFTFVTQSVTLCKTIPIYLFFSLRKLSPRNLLISSPLKNFLRWIFLY